MRFGKIFLSTTVICASLQSYALLPKQIEVIGHRGARSILPENTLPALKYAFDLGVDAVEIDVNVTKDNVVVVHHDQMINPENCQYKDGKQITNHLLIRELTLVQVKQFDCGSKTDSRFPGQRAASGSEIPTLREVFEMTQVDSKAAVSFTIEPKSNPEFPNHQPNPRDFAQLVLNEVLRYDLNQRVTIQSFDYRVLIEVRKLQPSMNIAALTGSNPIHFEKIVAESGANIISPYYKILTKDSVATMQKAGLKVIPWTVNTEQDWNALIEMGVDGIITDDPAALMKKLNRN